MIKAAFLDRDGVINIDHAYVHRWDEFEWVEGVLPAARRLVEAGYALVVVTNQSGIGRGYYSEADFAALTDSMRKAFAQAGAPVTAVYFCPHHPEKAVGQYKQTCNCRKPAPGMFLQAAADLDIDLTQSIMVGDKRSDMQAAFAAGIPTRILVGKDGASEPGFVPESTMTAKSLFEATCRLLPVIIT